VYGDANFKCLQCTFDKSRKITNLQCCLLHGRNSCRADE
jgi:hypothetical protein